MSSDEIKAERLDGADHHGGGEAFWMAQCAMWLKEVAYQLARMNERKVREALNDQPTNR